MAIKEKENADTAEEEKLPALEIQQDGECRSVDATVVCLVFVLLIWDFCHFPWYC